MHEGSDNRKDIISPFSDDAAEDSLLEDCLTVPVIIFVGGKKNRQKKLLFYLGKAYLLDIQDE